MISLTPSPLIEDDVGFLVPPGFALYLASRWFAVHEVARIFSVPLQDIEPQGDSK